MMRDKEDNDTWGVENDEHSLEFTFDQSIKMENSHSTSIKISLFITLYLHFTHYLNSSTLWEKLFAYLSEICTCVQVTSSKL